MVKGKSVADIRKLAHQLKKEALLREAIATFNQKGFHATSMDEIALNLGVTKAALYHYFPNKHTLLYEAFCEALRVGFEAVEYAEEHANNGFNKLEVTLRRYLEVTLSEMSRCVILTEEHALSNEHREIIVEQRDRFEAKLRGFVSEGIKDGSIIPCDPKLAIFALFGAINWVPKWYSEKGSWSNKQLAYGMSRLLCRSLAAAPISSLDNDIAKIEL